MDTKPWWQSKTIWGGVVQALVFVLGIFHVNIADLSDQITNGVYAVGAFIGVILVIVGRVKATKAISSQPPPTVGGPLMRICVIGAICGSIFFAGCAGGPIYPQSPAAVVGSDFQVAAHDALAAWADYKAGNVDLAWALQKMFSAYTDLATAPADVKALVKAWTGNTGDSQALADRLARIFESSSAPPAAKMAALADAAGTAAVKTP